MATVTFDQDSPGQGGSGPLFGSGSMPIKVATGTFSFDSSYPSGGESISTIFDIFKDGNGTSRLLGMYVQQPVQTGSQTGKFVNVDYTNKKLQLFTNASPFAEVADTSDQHLVANLRWFAWGKR